MGDLSAKETLTEQLKKLMKGYQTMNDVLSCDISPGVVTFKNFDYDENKSLLEQLNILQEDMIQIDFFDRYILDIGWYPSWDKNGCFKLLVIEGEDWNEPLLALSSKNIDELKDKLKEAIDFCRQL
jgi:hypothetical protein